VNTAFSSPMGWRYLQVYQGTAANGGQRLTARDIWAVEQYNAASQVGSAVSDPGGTNFGPDRRVEAGRLAGRAALGVEEVQVGRLRVERVRARAGALDPHAGRVALAQRGGQAEGAAADAGDRVALRVPGAVSVGGRVDRDRIPGGEARAGHWAPDHWRSDRPMPKTDPAAGLRLPWRFQVTTVQEYSAPPVSSGPGPGTYVDCNDATLPLSHTCTPVSALRTTIWYAVWTWFPARSRGIHPNCGAPVTSSGRAWSSTVSCPGAWAVARVPDAPARVAPAPTRPLAAISAATPTATARRAARRSTPTRSVIPDHPPDPGPPSPAAHSQSPAVQQPS
jgi:hypothetical protein